MSVTLESKLEAFFRPMRIFFFLSFASIDLNLSLVRYLGGRYVVIIANQKTVSRVFFVYLISKSFWRKMEITWEKLEKVNLWKRILYFWDSIIWVVCNTEKGGGVNNLRIISIS